MNRSKNTDRSNRRAVLVGGMVATAYALFAPQRGSTQMSLLSTPKAADPIIVDGRKYAPIENGSALSLPNKTGYISVVDVETIELLFIVQIFETAEIDRTDASPEQVIDITHDAAKNRLLLKTTENRSFTLDLRGLSVSPLAP